MSKYALVKNGMVDDVVLWDGGEQWSPPANTITRLLNDGQIVGPGYLFDPQTETYSPPPADPAATALAALLAQLNIDKVDLANQYQAGIDRMGQIRNATPPFTNTQRDTAIQDLATIILRLAKVVRTLVL